MKRHSHLRFVAVGTLVTVAVMGMVTAALPREYSVWAVVDTGTLGQQQGLGRFVNAFNAGEYRSTIAPFPGVIKARMVDARPKLLIRVDATEGSVAASAAERLAEIVVAQLDELSVLKQATAAADSKDAESFHESMAALDTWAQARLAEVRALRPEAARERQRTFNQLEALVAGRQQDSHEKWRALVQAFLAADESSDRLDQQIAAWEERRETLASDLPAPISNAMVPELRHALTRTPSSLGEFSAEVDQLHKILSAPVNDVPGFVPVRLKVRPQVPPAPTWPRMSVNLLIASIFGMVGSSLAALFLRPVDRDVRDEVDVA